MFLGPGKGIIGLPLVLAMGWRWGVGGSSVVFNNAIRIQSILKLNRQYQSILTALINNA